MSHSVTEKPNGKVAIVTGGGRGLGAAMTLGLARAGYNVVATAARERWEVETVAARAEQGRILPLVSDVTREEDCERAVEAALARFGRLDILVNNAGRGMKFIKDTFMTEPTRFWEADPQAWRLVIDTNVNGPFLMARAAVRPMLQNGWGRVINVSMNYQTMQRAGFSPYGPSKPALESETVIWAQDLAGTGVTVNALLPGGATLTGMIPPSVPESLKASLLAPEIMVPPLLWLASAASNGITGKRVVASEWWMGTGASVATAPTLKDTGWPPPLTVKTNARKYA
jgi:NAD(P)-dependent dehydrogenase (short-subunit alcohol dehydrogenase family)